LLGGGLLGGGLLGGGLLGGGLLGGGLLGGGLLGGGVVGGGVCTVVPEDNPFEPLPLEQLTRTHSATDITMALKSSQDLRNCASPRLGFRMEFSAYP
jgi:hypothetical protein